MRQVCPKCNKLVDLPDDSDRAPCPTCGEVLILPKTYSVAVDPVAVKPSIPTLPLPSIQSMPPISAPSATAAPPSYVPIPPPGYALPSSPIIPPTKGYDHSYPISIPGGACSWILAIGFTLIFLLLPLPWCGSYPGNVSVYSQSFWGSLTNSFSASIIGEQEFKQELPLRAALRSDWWLLLPYLASLLIGLGLAWMHQFVKAPDFAFRVGPLGTVRAMIWPRRVEILLGITLIALAFFILMSLRGFGLEAAAAKVTANTYTEELAKTASTVDAERLKVRMGIDFAKFGMASGYAWWIAGLIHVILVMATVLIVWFEKRIHSPTPRIVAEW
jgi:hypothetical protein